MKIKNSPGKKNSRRITASKRLMEAIKAEAAKPDSSIEKIEVLKGQLERVSAKITSEEVSRASKTKKDRRPPSY